MSKYDQNTWIMISAAIFVAILFAIIGDTSRMEKELVSSRVRNYDITSITQDCVYMEGGKGVEISSDAYNIVAIKENDSEHTNEVVRIDKRFKQSNGKIKLYSYETEFEIYTEKDVVDKLEVIRNMDEVLWKIEKESIDNDKSAS